jgi:hypothetical protein
LSAHGIRLHIRAVGHTADADTNTVTVTDGSLDSGSALLVYHRRGRVVGALSLDRPRQLPALRDQILAAALVDATVTARPVPVAGRHGADTCHVWPAAVGARPAITQRACGSAKVR